MIDLESYLYEHIPITRSLGVKVVEDSLDEVILSAPLQTNVNHKKTAFGGSLHSLTTLSCWSLLYINLIDLPDFEIVISHSEIDYIRPVTGDFQAICRLDHDHEEWRQFLRRVKRHGKTRFNLNAVIQQSSETAVRFNGTFVVLRDI